MKILLINKFHYLKGGSEKVYFDTKKILENHGHTVICFSMQDPRNLPSDQSAYFVPNVDFSDRSEWWRKVFRYFYYPEAGRRLAKLIEAEKPDLAHLHNVSHHLTYSILKPLRSAGIPIVQTLHDYQLISPNYNLCSDSGVDESCRSYKYYRCIINRCVRNSVVESFLATVELYFYRIAGFAKKIDLFISPSRFLKEKFNEWHFNEPMVVINNCADVEEIEPNYVPGDYILYFGRLSKEKGLMTLIRAVRKINNIKLVIVGDGSQRGSLEAYTKKKQVRNVRFVGFQYDDNLKPYLQKCRFAVFPSEWYENYPVAVIEIMAHGKPVLVADIGGLKELVTEGVDGWRFPVGKIRLLRDRIKDLYDQDALIEACGRRARKRVLEKNTSELYYQKILAVYEKVIADKKQETLG